MTGLGGGGGVFPWLVVTLLAAFTRWLAGLA